MTVSNSDHLDPDLHATESAPCRHVWVHINDSFDHAFGTEQVHSWECSLCGEVTTKQPKELKDNE